MSQLGAKIWFYVVVGLLNMAVGATFYVINIRITPPSTVVWTPPPAPVVIPVKQGIPTHITIPSLAIDLPVGVGSYDQASGNWLVDATKAYYADMSLPVNDHNGNTLIYGHAQAPVFARLPQIQAGSEAVVTTDTGFAFHYSYQAMREVSPSDISVFYATGPPTLTLQTCMGDWDAYRGLFSFKLDSVVKV